jgi:hypothetical protein
MIVYEDPQVANFSNCNLFYYIIQHFMSTDTMLYDGYSGNMFQVIGEGLKSELKSVCLVCLAYLLQ